jgi:hypothetical protein
MWGKTLAIHLPQPMQASIDVGIVAVILGTLGGVVPAVAAVLGLLYYAIQVWESATVKEWVRSYRQRHAARRLRKLAAKQKVLQASIAAAELVRQATAVAAVVIENAKAEATIAAQAPVPPLSLSEAAPKPAKQL